MLQYTDHINRALVSDKKKKKSIPCMSGAPVKTIGTQRDACSGLWVGSGERVGAAPHGLRR